MKFKNLFRNRKKDHSFIISINCGEEIHRKTLHPKVAQERVYYKCPNCGNTLNISTIDFYQTDYYKYDNHVIEYIDIFYSFCWSK